MRDETLEFQAFSIDEINTISKQVRGIVPTSRENDFSIVYKIWIDRNLRWRMCSRKDIDRASNAC